MNVTMQDQNTSTPPGPSNTSTRPGLSDTSSPLGLSISQAAHELGVSLGTIRRWADLGYIESYRTPGGQRRFSREQLDRFVGSLNSGGRRGSGRLAV
jgi:excisionase family DNA binding protein